MCFNCDENSRALDDILQPIIPISLYSKPSPLRDWLTFYMDDGDVTADQNAREAIETTLELFFVENHAWAASLAVDTEAGYEGATNIHTTLHSIVAPFKEALALGSDPLDDAWQMFEVVRLTWATLHFPGVTDLQYEHAGKDGDAQNAHSAFEQAQQAGAGVQEAQAAWAAAWQE